MSKKDSRVKCPFTSGFIFEHEVGGDRWSTGDICKSIWCELDKRDVDLDFWIFRDFCCNSTNFRNCPEITDRIKRGAQIELFKQYLGDTFVNNLIEIYNKK